MQYASLKTGCMVGPSRSHAHSHAGRLEPDVTGVTVYNRVNGPGASVVRWTARGSLVPNMTSVFRLM
jgi:hypothetical protein